MGGKIDLQLPCVKLSRDEVVVAADQLEGSVCHTLLDERVSAEVLEGHVDGLLWMKTIKRDLSLRELIHSFTCKNISIHYKLAAINTTPTG